MPYFIGELRIQRIVFVERVVPHGRPEVVGLEPQQQFKNLLVKLMVVVAELFFTQPERAGASSLRKMPRYLTAGGP